MIRRFFKKKILNKNVFIILLLCVTFINISCFFYIKNSTHYLLLGINKLKADVLYEKNILSMKQVEFNKKYNIQNLRELANNRLKLQFSNVNQIVDFKDILKK